MSELKRLLDAGSDATRAERKLLAHAAAPRPTKSEQDAVWAALVATLPPLPNGPMNIGHAVVGPHAAGAAASGASALVKAGAVFLSVALTVGGAVAARNAIASRRTTVSPSTLEHSRPRGQASQVEPREPASVFGPEVGPKEATPSGAPPTMSPPVVARRNAEVSHAPVSAPSSRDARPATRAPVANDAAVAPSPLAGDSAPKNAANAIPTTPASLSQLREESRALAAVRAALVSGELGAARRNLDSVRARFPQGVLVQERRELSIEIRGRSGDVAVAKAEAEAFLRDYPSSPHATAVRRWLNAP